MMVNPTSTPSAPRRRYQRLFERIRRGKDLLSSVSGPTRAKLTLYFSWDFLNHTLGVPGVRREIDLELSGCRVTIETFSSQLGAYLDIFHYGVYEQLPEFRSKPGDVVIDAGANIGFYALKQAQTVGPTGRVYSFEPSPGAFRLLEHNVGRNGLEQVECIRAALSDRRGTMRFASARRASSCGHLVREGEDVTDQDVIDVPTLTLDEFVRERGITRIDLLKMDTEGAETAIVRGGADRALAITQRIVMESHRTRYDVRDFLAPRGLALVRDGHQPNIVYFERTRL